MIHVDRSRVPMPMSLAPGGRAEEERARAYSFFSQYDRQRRFDFAAFKSKDVSQALRTLFHEKCAYCETRITSGAPPDIEMYRPKGGVAENRSHPGYWWLASDWDNLLISCIDCNRQRAHENEQQRVVSGKANRFPLAVEANRALGPGDNLALEAPMLLNPCIDDPEMHLVFDWSGTVASDTARGQTTIAVLGLNRSGLVQARARAAKEIRFSLDMLPTLKDAAQSPVLRDRLERVVVQLQGMTQDDAEYAGMKRQLLRPELGKLQVQETTVRQFGWDTSRPAVSKARRTLAKKEFQKFEQAQSSYTLETEEGKETSKSQRRDIERISVQNFKGIRRVDIDLVSVGRGGGWLMLLGENSVGKSSILQAIALCLGGAVPFASLVRDKRVASEDLINADARARKAIVTVKLTGFVEPHEMTVTPDGATFKRPLAKSAKVVVNKSGTVSVSGDEEAKNAQFVLLGYGATRLLPRGNARNYGHAYARIDNLFDAFLPLFDADVWLATVEKDFFDEVALALKDLLSIDTEATLLRPKGRVVVDMNGDKAPIKRLSDGFQSVVAMTIDILEVAIRLWGTSRSAEGIVLLDEIGAHLHPTWKMRIVTSLRKAFPGMQFIATTHDPLCLRGLGEGEVVVMKRGVDRHIEAVTDLPSPADFRVDQLLTSEFFGLSSTVDPETERKFDQYYALLALPTRSPEQETQLAQFQGELPQRRYVGDTVREQLMFEAVDRVVARHRAAGNLAMPAMKDEASSEIARLWNESVSSVLRRS